MDNFGIEIKQSLAWILCNFINDTDHQEGSDTITCKTCNFALLKGAIKGKLVCHEVLNNERKISSYTCFTNAVLACQKYPDTSKTDITEIKHFILHAGQQQMREDESQILNDQFLSKHLNTM